MNIRQEIIKLCDDMITFWDRLKKEIEQIPNENKANIVLKWRNYFPEHNDAIINLIHMKMKIESVERELIENDMLRYEN